MDIKKDMEQIARQAKEAAAILAAAPTGCKNKALLAMADALLKEQKDILQENQKDMAQARKSGISPAMLDRLLLTEARIESMAEGLRQVAALPDPVGEIIGGRQAPNGLKIEKVRVPLGVIGIIYEARPNVTADAAGLCLKTGNAVILRGGSEAIKSNIAVARALSRAAETAGLPKYSLQLVETTDRQAVDLLLRLNAFIDVIIPRGGAGLIKKVVETSSVPVIETGIGVCHTFVDETADCAMASDIVFNAKVSRPAVCNSLETLLVHEKIAAVFLPAMLERLAGAQVEIFGCPVTRGLYGKAGEATEEDWAAEYSGLKLAVKVVSSLQEALLHIERYGSRHSEAIVTENYSNAQIFLQKVDAAAVYANASTRFTDGFEFGFGAEIGISTQKLHARGPMGLPELTSVKYIVRGSGQIR